MSYGKHRKSREHQHTAVLNVVLTMAACISFTFAALMLIVFITGGRTPDAGASVAEGSKPVSAYTIQWSMTASGSQRAHGPEAERKPKWSRSSVVTEARESTVTKADTTARLFTVQQGEAVEHQSETARRS